MVCCCTAVLCFFELMLYHHSKDFYFIFLVKFLLNLFYCTSSNLLLLWFCSTNFKSNKISYNNDQYQTLCFTDFYTEIRSCIRGPDFNNRKIITMFSTESTLKMNSRTKMAHPKQSELRTMTRPITIQFFRTQTVRTAVIHWKNRVN